MNFFELHFNNWYAFKHVVDEHTVEFRNEQLDNSFQAELFSGLIDVKHIEEHVQPIFLNEAHLLNNGWHKIKDGNGDTCYTNYQINFPKLYERDYNTWFADGIFCLMYVHQLQNVLRLRCCDDVANYFKIN